MNSATPFFSQPPLPENILKEALSLAHQAFEADEIPVGAVVFNSKTFEIIAMAHNKTIALCDPLAHAEILAIREACKIIGEPNLTGYSIFSTLEPCVMCAGACAWSKLDAVYFGASDPKSGGIDVGACVFTHKQTHHKPKIYRGYCAEECGTLMTQFFKRKRKKK